MNNNDSPFWQFFILVVLIFASAFFTLAEIALISLNKNKLEKKSLSGNRQAKRILSLTGNPSKFLATNQVGTTLTNFMASAFAADTFSGRFTSWLVSLGVKIPYNILASVSLVSITLILSYFSIVLSELLPKRIALKKADALAFPLSGSVLFFSRIFAPVVWFLTKSTNGILRLIGIDPKTDAHAVTEEEIRLMIDVGSAKGTIRAGEKEILHNVFEFDDKTAGDVMTHRRDTVLLKLEDSDDEWEKAIIESRHNFFPVCGKNQDDIAGVLVFRDYLCLSDRRRETVMARAVRPAQFVPITVRTHTLFARMKKSRNHFAVVVDEHGSLMGIVTMKDLLEELVGNLDDDSTALPEQPLIAKTGPGKWTLNGAVSLDKAAHELDVTLPVERYDTFAGFVFSLLGEIPEDGSQAVLEAHGLKIELLKIREHRLEKVLVTKVEPVEPKEK
jgi:putative hemolysin